MGIKSSSDRLLTPRVSAIILHKCLTVDKLTCYLRVCDLETYRQVYGRKKHN